MSDRFGLKVKENAGKTKYSSLNLNQTYKGTKVETKTSSGTARHGLQSLGKVGASRRIPPPANLPSLKSENSGNDPTVSLVPSGGGGWGSAKEKPSENPPTTSQVAPSSSTPSQTNVPSSQQPLLQPQRPIPPPSHPQQPQPQSQNSGQTQTQPAKQHSESQAKTWGNVSSNGAGGPGRTYSHQEMPYFNREFPVLGVGNSGERMPQQMEEKDHPQYGPQPVMRNTHEPAWMERSGPGPPPPEYGPGRERPEVYNGGPAPGYPGGPQYRRPPEYQHGPHGKNYPPQHHGNVPYGHGPGPGRHPHGYPPDYHSRGPVHKPGAGPGPVHPSKLYDKGRGEGYGRPAILKPEDIQAMADNDEEEEGGWAGAQEEVDYSAKLDFEDFEEDEKPPGEKGKVNRDSAGGEGDTRWHSNEGRTGKDVGPPPTRAAWAETQGHPHPYSDSRQAPPGPGMRPFDSRGSPPGPGWPMPYPQHVSSQQRGGGPPMHPPHQVSSDQGKPMPKEGEPVVNEWQKRRVKQQEEMRAAVERARRRREEEELKRQAEQKAAAAAKLKELELKRVRRESAKEGDDTWAEELDFIEKDSYNRESANEQQMSESLDREHELQNMGLNQQDGAMVRSEVPEHVNRQRNDSESSDASRSSASRGTSRSHHHPPRDIPPRFQQQQLRQQQQQQHFQSHYQQPQSYPQQYQYHQQQVARSPQHRDFQEGPLAVSSHYPVVDTGPVSPSQPLKPDQPVKRIMKRSDSSSTAGDDIASVKSLESGSGEPLRESEKRPSAAPSDGADKTEITSQQTKEDAFEPKKSESTRMERKSVDDHDTPVFDEVGSVGSGDAVQRKQQESDKARLSGSDKEKVVEKERVLDTTERKDSRDSTAKPVSEKTAQTRDRREERRSSKRDERPQHVRRGDDSKDQGKRKREDHEDSGRFPERRGRFAGRDDSKRERIAESHGRGRVSYHVRGHGRGMTSGTAGYRGRGRGERGGRDSRDHRESKPARSCELKASPPAKIVDSEQKLKEEDKENVALKENSDTAVNDITGKNVDENMVTVKQEKVLESGPTLAEKEAVIQGTVEDKVIEDKKEAPLQQEKKVREGQDRTSKLPDKEAEKPRRQDDPRKKSDSYRESTNLKPKGRGGFGKPPQYSEDSRSSAHHDKRPGGRKFTDKRRTTQERGRDRGEDYEERRSSRNERSTAGDNRNLERGREKEQKSQPHHDERETGNRRPSQDDKRYTVDDRKKRISEKDDDRQYSRQRTDDRNQRGSYPSSYSTRGRFGKPPVRGSVRGSVRGGRSNQPVGSGRFGNNYRRSKSTDEELSDDDYDSDSSSYTTATSASEERVDEKPVDKETDVKRGKDSGTSYDKSRGTSRSTRSPIRGKVSSRAGGRGAGGFGRSRREVERPPRFQKQQERERAGMARGVSRADRQSEGRDSGPGRGRGRGRGRREQFPKDSSTGPGIPVTEDWDEELGDSSKEGESSRGDKTGIRRESASRRGFPAPRSTSDRTRKDKSRESGGTRNTSRREPFLAERQQAKVEGSKSGGGEPRVALPAARNGFSKDGNRRSDMQSHSHGTGLDSITTGVSESKVVKKQETHLRKTDIQQFDLHNIAGVICIDDMTDDDSDISSTLSGFVQVTSRRAQKEYKDRQREEEERRKKADEQNRQRGSQTGNKKNQASKPPRFNKQHMPQANSQNKPPGVIGKSTNTSLSETVIGLPNAMSNSNPSSASSTKRNSPVTVERPVSPPPPPVFNAWDKPLIVTPAKPPSVTPLVTSSVPDPLAVGSGKPSSTRPAQSGAVIPSATSLIEDASVDEDYIAMTKEIALLAPPEEPEENEEPAQPVTKTNPKVETSDQTTERGAKVTDTSERKSQPKPQREKPPRFDRTGKRRVAANSDETKREQSGGAKGRKNSRDSLGSQKPQAKALGDNMLKGKTTTPSSTQQSVSPEEQTSDGVESSKEAQESEECDAANVEDMVTTASDEGSEGKDDMKESEDQEAKDDSESESSRKDSEPDLHVDSTERNDDGDNLFSTGSLTVDIHERPTADRPVREPSPVSPAIFEMTKKMEASRKLWDGGLGIGRTSNPVSAWEETLRTPASVSSSIVGMPVVESSELRLNDDQVAVSKSQGELEENTSKADSKPSDGISFTKKPGSGEQQNVCKVKPQQQQQPLVKPQQTSSIVPQTTEENRPAELSAVPLSQPLLTQDQLLAQQAIPQRYAFPFVSQYMDLQQRQPFLQQQQLQQLQQTNQQVTPTFPLTHVQQVNQARSSSSPLSQATQDIYQSSLLAGGVYSAGNFQGTQPFVSVALLPSTTTQSFVTSTSGTQTSSLMGVQPQQPKTATGSVFPQNVNPQGGQTMYMPFDPKTLSGGTPLFNLTQSAQRHLLGAQSGIVGENVPRQGGFPTTQPTHQPFQGAYPFQQKQGAYDVSQEMQMKQKPSEQTDFARQSELVKHVNAKPFEPPKRSTPGSVSAGNAAVGPLMSSTFAQNPNMMTVRPSPPDLGGTSQSPPVSTSLISGRPVSMSPVDPGVPFPGAVGTFPKHTAIGQFQVQQQPQGVQPQQFTPFQQQPVGIQHTLQIRPQGQQQQPTVNPLTGATAAILPNPAVMAATMPRQLIRATGLGIGMGGAQPSAPNAQRFPAPIQRPMTASLMHGIPHMQAPRGPRPQAGPPQMVPTKQQIVSNRPQMTQPSVPHQNPVAAAFKMEQHHKMLEQTRMFFAQQGQQQLRVPPQNIPVDQQPKAVTSSQGDKPTVKGQQPRETYKLQEKKEEVNPRNKKTNSEQPNKTSKTTKVDSKPDESSKDKNITKQDGKGAATKSSNGSSSSLIRIQPLPMPARNKSNRPRGPPRMPGMPASKAKFSGRPEKEVKDTTAPDKPSESLSPKSSDQAKVSDAQSVPPLSVNKG